MAKILHFIGPTGLQLARVAVQDSSIVPIAAAPKVATSVVACTGGSLELAGATSNGNMTYTSIYGGLVVNEIRVAHQPGVTGPGHEDRPLTIDVSGMDLQVVFGTDADGGTQIPTAAAVAAAINADPQNHVAAEAGGDGTGPVGSYALTNLEGGLDNGDRYKWNVIPPRVDVINLIETV